MLWIDDYGRVWETQRTRFGTLVARRVYDDGESAWEGITRERMKELGFVFVA